MLSQHKEDVYLQMCCILVETRLDSKSNKPLSDFSSDVFGKFVCWFMGPASLGGENKLIYFNSLILESKGPSLAVIQTNLSSGSYFYEPQLTANGILQPILFY